MEASSVLRIRSIDQLEQLYKNLKTPNSASLGYRAALIIQSDDEYDIITLHDDTMFKLLVVTARLCCTKLSMLNVAFNVSDIRVKPLRHVREIEVMLCRGVMHFIPFIIKRCPNLVKFSETSMGRLSLDANPWIRSKAMVGYTDVLMRAVTTNYRLLNFESLSMTDELKLLMAATIKQEHRTPLQKYCKIMKVLLKRNNDGDAKCTAAIIQILLIKRYRPHSVFQFTTRDIVKMICKLVLQTRGTFIWCS